VFQCVVQSYLQWLQDSDYDPTCRLCGKNLTDDVDRCGKCVRLQCYGKDWCHSLGMCAVIKCCENWQFLCSWCLCSTLFCLHKLQAVEPVMFLLCLVQLSRCHVPIWTCPQGGRVHCTHAAVEASSDCTRSSCLVLFDT